MATFDARRCLAEIFLAPDCAPEPEAHDAWGPNSTWPARSSDPAIRDELGRARRDDGVGPRVPTPHPGRPLPSYGELPSQNLGAGGKPDDVDVMGECAHVDVLRVRTRIYGLPRSVDGPPECVVDHERDGARGRDGELERDRPGSRVRAGG
jgi:hypothetical protein